MEQTEIKHSDAETTKAMLAALRERYKRPEWCFLTEVPDGTGANASRRADAFAYNLFPSKGNVTICFELKASKSDLKKELADGTKSNAVGQFADYFFLVCPEGIVDETMLLPKTWGILTFKNGKLKQTKRPEELTPKTMTKNFVAALLQSTFRNTDSEISQMNKEIDKIVNERLQTEFEYHMRYKEDEWKRERDRLKKEIEAVSKWRDAMRECYKNDYYAVLENSRWGKVKNIDEMITSDNIVKDLADFIQLRKNLMEESEYTLNGMKARVAELEKIVEGMHKLMLKPTEYIQEKEK